MNIPKPNQHEGPMAGHVRKGRVYKPPLAATGLLRAGDWFKDDLPDLIWPVLVLEEQGHESIHRLIAWQKAVQEALLGEGQIAFVAESLDGRLTHLESLAEKFPDATETVVKEATRLGLLSERVRHALGSYPFLPASWLIGERDPQPPSLADLELIRDSLLGVLRDSHREALLKCLRTWSTVQAGTFRSDTQMLELLKNYPNDVGTRSMADTVIRAGWGAHKSVVLINEPNHFDDAIKWARVFWGANSITSGCVRKGEVNETIVDDDEHEELKVENSSDSTLPHQEGGPTPMPAEGANLRPFAMDLLASFVEALETAPMHLQQKEQQEVISGLVARAGRDLIAVLTVPDLWCMEHGAHITRMLVETKIYLRWMSLQDPTIYKEFQAYGAGKVKLYARIAEELPEEAQTAGFREATEELERLSHNSSVLDHRIVDTRDTFAGGKSIRAMAEEAGLLDFYRQAYSLASGVAHSEWWSIETHAMEPCLNVLHGVHLIPSLSLNYGGNVQLATSWVDQFYSLVRTALSILGTDAEAVATAFAWLDEADEKESASASG